MEITNRTDEELKVMYKQIKKDAEYATNMSEVLKIYINSFY
jgi:hypothetical protein